MVRRYMLALLLLSVPSAAWAQKGPEQLLPSGSQLYFRFDGFDAHRAAFDQTATGKMLQGDTGKFLTELFRWGGEAVNSVLGQLDPQAAQVFKDLGIVVQGIGKHGILLGIEVKSLTPPDVQATFVLPKSSNGPLLGLIKKAVESGPAPIKETRVGA